MLKQLLRLALVILLVSIACGLPAPQSEIEVSSTPKAVAQLLVTAGPDATATATPFQPVAPTATAFARNTLVPTKSAATATAVVEQMTQTPIPVVQRIPVGTVNLLVMGSDFRPSSGFRTDVIMLVSINTNKGTVSAVSFPRDLYLTIPGWGENRINTAFPHGGFDMMADTFEYNFGVRPTYYVLTNFQGFERIVDSLGGINVNVGQYLKDKCDLPQAKNTYCTVNPGVVHMDGATALWYVRSRYSSSDFDRTRRAQEVLYAIFTKLMSLDAVKRLPELYNTYKQSVETNMTIEDITPLLPVASEVISDPDRVRRFAVGPGEAYRYFTPSGADVLLPNYAAIQAIIQEALNP